MGGGVAVGWRMILPLIHWLRRSFNSMRTPENTMSFGYSERLLHLNKKEQHRIWYQHFPESWVAALACWERLDSQVLQTVSFSERVWGRQMGESLSWAHLKDTQYTRERFRGKGLKFCFNRWGPELLNSELIVWFHKLILSHHKLIVGWGNLFVNKCFNFLL